MVIIDYEQYQEILEQIQELLNILNEVYTEITNEETKQKITNYMTRSGRWI